MQGSVFKANIFEDHWIVTVLLLAFFCIIICVLLIWIRLLRQFCEKAFAQATLRWVEFVTEIRGVSPELVHLKSAYGKTEVSTTRMLMEEEIIASTEQCEGCAITCCCLLSTNSGDKEYHRVE